MHGCPTRSSATRPTTIRHSEHGSARPLRAAPENSAESNSARRVVRPRKGNHRRGVDENMIELPTPQIEYLASQRLGRIATAGSDNKPHVVPTSFRYNP